jgi:hypothetical protein
MMIGVDSEEWRSVENGVAISVRFVVLAGLAWIGFGGVGVFTERLALLVMFADFRS